jgi:hypothetical protein
LRIVIWTALFLCCTTIVLCGCGSKEAPLSKAALTFKQEIKGGLKKLSPALAEPVAKDDVQALNAVLKDNYIKAEKAGKPLAFQILILDRHGVTLTSYPTEKAGVKRFSDYQVIKKTLGESKIVQERFYLPDGGKFFAICAPLVSNGKVVGALAMGFEPKELSQKWGVSEQEFMAIDFNK